jgi:hypothetical protein
MKVKIKDLELALENIRTNSNAEWVDIEVPGGPYVALEYTDVNKHVSKIKLYECYLNSSPEIVSTKKLYREEA